MNHRGLLRQSLLVASREIRTLLTTPFFYVLAGIFFLANAWVYVQIVWQFVQAQMQPTPGNDVSPNVTVSVIRQSFYVTHFFLMVQIPLLTMRTIAEERRQGTLALLQTTLVSDWAIVLGKFLGNWVALVAYLALNFLFTLTTVWLSSPEWPVIIASIVALVLSVGGYVALGVFCSSLTESQVVAAVISYVMVLMLMISGALADSVGITPLSDFLNHFASQRHVDNFLQGNVAAVDAGYFVFFAIAFLFLAVRQLESLRWRS